MDGAFRITHTVPAEGMDTWAEPGDTAVGPRLGGHLPVQLLRVWGDWGQVRCENDWTAWVDARRLVRAGAAAPGQPQAAASTPAGATTTVAGVRLLTPSVDTAATLVGAGLLVVGALLDWIDGIGTSGTSALDVPLAFLIDKENAADGGLGLGLTLIVLGLAAALLRHLPGATGWARLPGTIALALTLAFVLQLNSLLDAVGDLGGAPSLMDTLGIGVWVTLVGSGLVIWGGSR